MKTDCLTCRLLEPYAYVSLITYFSEKHVLKDDIVEWQEVAKEEHEGCNADESKCRLLQRTNKLHNLQLPGIRGQSRLDGEICNDEHS